MTTAVQIDLGSTSITTLGTITTGVWNGTTITSVYGGSGVSSPTPHGILVAEGSSPFTSIVLGAGQVLIGTTSSDPSAADITGTANQITITSTSGSIVASIPSAVIFPGTVTLNADPTTSLEAATKQYVDTAIANLQFQPSVYAASELNFIATYSNGSSGVGATLTYASGPFGPFGCDSIIVPLNARVLVKNQSIDYQNGIYVVTFAGTSSLPWILTRATNYDTPSQINPGDFILVDNGVNLKHTAWIQTATVTAIGTDSITFVSFGGSGVVSVSGTTNRITSTGGSTPVIDISASYVGQSSITTLGTIATGVWNGSVVALAYGGTNANLTASNGGIFYSTASAGAILAGTATADQVLLSGSSTTPAWSTATYPATTTINQILYSSSANTIVGLATANNGVLITSSGGVPSISTTIPNATQLNITSLGTISTGVWNGTTITVPYGGTGNTTFTAYSIICAGTTATGVFQNVSGVGTSGQVLTSNGASALPTWQAGGGGGTVTSVSGTSLQIDVANGTTTPVISIDAGYVGQTSITTLGTITTGVWNGTTITSSHGGSGVSSPTPHGILVAEGSSPFTSIVLGAGQVLIGTTSSDPSAADITGTANQITVTSTSGSIVASIPSAVIFPGTVTLNADPTTSLEAATKQYVDAISQGLTFKDSCYCGSTANLSASYSNGVSGVGATLTNNSTQVAFSIDGVSPSINSRVLVKDQSTAFQNGIYTLTTVGSGSTNWVLTRSTDYDLVTEIQPGDFVLIDNGTVNAGTGWVETATVTTIGTDSISFSQFGASNVVSVSGTTNRITSTGGTTPVIDISASYVGQSSITTLGTITTGVWNGTAITVPYGGTGNTTFTAYSVICAGTTATGTFQNVSGLGSSGQVLTSAGASALPTWQTPVHGTVTSVSGTALQIDVATGTTTPVISIDAGYVGQTSITTLGTITTGTWNGSIIGLAYGGTNANLTASNGGIFYSTASAGAILAGTATANQVLLSGSSTTPAWSTATYPATTTINQILYSSSANTIVGLATANNGVLITSSGGVPSISTTIPNATQLNITSLGTISTGVWNGTTITVPYGGTGNTTFTAYSIICAGTTATGVFQNVSGVGTSGQVLTSNGASALPTWQAGGGGSGTVTSVASGLGIKGGTITTTGTLSLDLTVVTQRASVVAGTAGNNLTTTYSNGSSGVGATLTNSGTQVAFTVDTISPAVNSRILVKDQSTAFQNGIYTLTTVGSVSTNWVLTRATDFDGSITGGIAQGVTVFIQSGAFNAQTTWMQSASGPFTIGTTSITFSTYGGQYTITTLGTITSGAWNGSPITVPYGGTGNTTFTAYSVICAGTTATGTFQNAVGLGSSGQVLTSNGASTLPTWQSKGTVTSVGSSLGLTGTVTTTGNLGLDLTVVTQRASVTAASTANLTATYSNGSSGVGATLTNSGTQAQFSIDGISGGGRVLIKDQTITAYNGIYTVTNQGSVSTNWVLTRATDFDGSITGGIAQGVTVFIQSGAVNSLSTWMQSTAGPFTIGTTPITFSGYGNPIPVPNGGTGQTGFTAYSLICAGTTATGLFQNVSGVGTSGQFLTSNGASALPSWQTTAVPVAAVKSDQITATSITVYVNPGVQQYHPSATKVWIRYTTVTTTNITASYNVTSLTDNGTGDTTVNFTTSFSGAYGFSGIASRPSSFGATIEISNLSAPAAGTVRLQNCDAGGGPLDAANLGFSAFGAQ